MRTERRAILANGVNLQPCLDFHFSDETFNQSFNDEVLDGIGKHVQFGAQGCGREVQRQKDSTISIEDSHVLQGRMLTWLTT